MGKAKPTKKTAPSKPLKISTSLFKRRLSKSSREGPGATKEKEKDPPTTPKSTKKSPTTKGKGEKAKEKEPSTAKSRKRSISPTTSKVVAERKKKTAEKEPSSASASPAKGKGKSAASTNKKPAPVSKRESTGTKGTPSSSSKPSGKVAARKKEKSPSPARRGSVRRSSSSSTVSSESSQESSSKSKKKKVVTRRKSKGDSTSKDLTKQQQSTDDDEEREEESADETETNSETESRSSGSDSSTANKKKGKKKPPPKKTKKAAPASKKKVPKKAVGRKIVKKASLLASRKKLPTKGKTKGKKEEKEKKAGGKKGGNKDKESSSSSSTSSTQPDKKKSKIKPRPKKRMASLNAKAILEASFSFENQDKRQKSPGPSPLSTSTTNKGGSKEADEKKSPHISVSTSPLPSQNSFIPIQNLEKIGERKRKSEDSKGSSAKDPNHVTITPVRRNSEKGEGSKSHHPKKRSKVSTTSTSTGTSPPPKDQAEERRKQGKASKTTKGVGSGGTPGFTGSEARNKDSGVQSNQVKSAGSQAKERKSSSSVSHFGTVYQPAGPLIEPHKTPSVPSGILPESVKLPPDLKVTYQTHPPSSNVSTTASGSKGNSSRKHGSTSTTTSSSSTRDKKSGQILHQPYKSSQSQSSSSSTSTRQQGSSSSGSFVSPLTATGSPLLLNHPSSSSASSSAGMAHHGHVGHGGHSVPSVGSTSGLFYSTPGFPSHHSPFAPNKYPMVPPESYRTHSPYQNSFLYPSATPAQQTQSYFMTPFYTPPLTPNSNPVISGGLGPVLGGQQRPLSLHHPAIAAAPFYPQTALQPHPSSYLVASPHHSLQPTPTAPGHAGLFPHNPSTQPACPCPTESCPPSSTSSNRQQRSVSNALHPVPQEGIQGAKKILPRRQKQPPSTPDTPPITISLISSGENKEKAQVENAKTFTEQYSLPDDITITPIIVTNPNPNPPTTALLLKNTSISVVPPPSGNNSSPNNKQGNKQGGISPMKKKEKDIVHVIDPRSGHRTTIAKHISNRNLLVKGSSNGTTNRAIPINNRSPQHVVASASPPTLQPKPAVKKIGVGKLHPDLDVIVINNKNSNTGSSDCDDHSITENVPKGLVVKLNKGKGSNSILHQGGGKGRVSSSNSSGGPLNYSLPRGISISSGGPGVFQNQNQLNEGLNLSMKKQHQQQNSDPNFVQVQAVNQSQSNKGKKRITLTECIDGLQKKRMKLLEVEKKTTQNGNVHVIPINAAANKVLNHRLPSALTPHALNHSATTNGPISNKVPKSVAAKLHDSTYSSARVRDPQLHRGGTVIKSSDAVAAVSAVVLDPETYHLKQRLGVTVNGTGNKGLKNGFAKSKKFNTKTAFLPTSARELNYVVGMSKVKVKGIMDNPQRSTRSAAANSKIRTRLSATNKKGGGSANLLLPGDQGQGRSRSRLLRKGNQVTGVVISGSAVVGTRKGGGGGESDSSSTNTSRSNSAIRIINGHVTTSRVDRENRNKLPMVPSQAFVNAVADLYQYRRNVLLRVPRASAGVFPSASNADLSNNPGQEGPPLKGKGSPSIVGNQNESGGSSRSASPATPTSTSPPNKLMVGSMAANAAKKRAMVKPLSPAAINGALIQMGMARRGVMPKWSNGWRFEGEPYDGRVLLNNDDPPVIRRCYPAMRHESGDVIQSRDCVLLKSGSRKNDLPFIAKVAALWENPTDGEMMFSLLWYYRPEHTEMGRTKEDMPDEIFASKHIDVNSVATIDDRCYVLTFNEYCRYRKRLKQLQEGLPDKPLLSLAGTSMINNNAAGNIAGAVWSGRFATDAAKAALSELPSASSTARPPSPGNGKVSPDVVFFCRKVYDFRQKRIVKNPS